MRAFEACPKLTQALSEFRVDFRVEDIIIGIGFSTHEPMPSDANELQHEIETILLDTDDSVDDRIVRLRRLFEREGISVFSDFDDTVVDSRCVFFGRLTLLERLGRLDAADGSSVIDRVLAKYFRLNEGFSRALADHAVSGRIVIISRNYHALIRRFVLHADRHLHDAGHSDVSIVGGIGQIPGIFTYRSRDKLAFLPAGSRLIADSFEHETVRTAEHVILVDGDRRGRVPWLYMGKVARMCVYLLRVTLLRRPY